MPESEKVEPDKKVEFKEVERITREIATTQCKYCGSRIPINSIKCPNCGANLS
jgi:rubrerythrin